MRPDYARHLPLARSVAAKSNHQRFNLAAVCVRGGAVLSVGYNRLTSDPKAYWGCSLHAELDAILGAGDLSGSKILVYRFTKTGSLANSKPCALCAEAIRRAGIRSVIYWQGGACRKDRA